MLASRHNVKGSSCNGDLHSLDARDFLSCNFAGMFFGLFGFLFAAQALSFLAFCFVVVGSPCLLLPFLPPHLDC
jgi:hypothetical protein